MSTSGKSGCLKSCAGGCAAAAILLVVLAVGAWTSRDSIRKMGPFRRFFDTVETAKSEAVQMNVLGAQLSKRYPAQAIPIRAHIQSDNGKTVKALVVTFVNPEFVLPESADGKEAKAREIALAIAADYPTLARYDQLRLAFVTENAGGASLGSTSEFQFPTAELSNQPPASP